MSVSLFRRAVVAFAVITGAACMAGCPGGQEAQAKKAESKWEGTYESTTAKETLQIMAEHKAVMRDERGPADLTWEPAGEDKIIVHVPFPVQFFRTQEGLRDSSGTVWKKKG